MASKTKLLIANNIAKLTLSNVDIHNAFDNEIISELRENLARVSGDKTVRALLLQADGKHFCAGADLVWMKRMAEHSEEENLKDARQLAGLMSDLYNMPMPTLVAVQGAAYGGAVGLIACCDIAIASDKARFCLSEVKLGLAPATIGPYVVSAMGARRCAQLFMTASIFNAEEAKDYGLIHETVVHDQLTNAVDKTLSQLLMAGPKANKAAKQLIRACIPSFDSNLAETTSSMIAMLRVSEEGQEGLHAFFDKRSPNWVSKHEGY
jgi:methylglutaconyl-CoA hydratase